MLKVLVQGDTERARKRYAAEGWDFFDQAPPFEDESYDIIVLDHLLPQARRRQVGDILRLYRRALKPGGQIIIIVPSLEWACTKIATVDDPSIMTFMSIYGDDENPFLCGFTLLWLRLEVARSGFQVVAASGEWYMATVAGKEEEVMQDVVTGIKIPDPDPAEAIA
jgi:SAM-dependent methyltransferase